MALSAALAQHRKKLASASPVLALQGCAGVTHTLSTSPAALGSEGGNQAIAACLGHELRVRCMHVLISARAGCCGMLMGAHLRALHTGWLHAGGG